MKDIDARFWAVINRSWTQAEQRVMANRADAVDDGELSLVEAFGHLVLL